jgi:hypothetical protein
MLSSPEAAAFIQFGAFLTDVAIAAVAAWLLVRACSEIGRGILESLLAWCLAFVAMAAAAGVVLGETGGLGAAGFLAFHAGLLAALALGRHSRLAGDLSEASRIAREARLFLTSGGLEAFAAASLLLVLFLLAGVAALAEPSGADALSYHLPRIGQWLLDGHVHELASQDERMNFVATVPDLVMSWLICGTRVGFRPLVLAQAFGGIMTVGATVGLARQTGLGRGPALLAGALLLGMANVAVQFASAQTDLFTTGVFASAFYLWACALRRGTGSWLGGLGAGLALGSKGTLFYLAPGALIWVAAFSWNARLPWTKWGRTLLAAAIGVVFFALPGFARNCRIYGNALGPKEWVSKLHQGALSPRDYQRKLRWNLTSSLAQVFEPQSQPHGLRAAGRAAVGALERHVPASDPYTLDGLGRKATFQNAFLGRSEPDADVTSFGIVAFILFAAGSLASLVRLRRGGTLVAAWSAGVLVFLLFFHGMQQWHPYAFRYFILAAPWIAVVGAWGIEQVQGTLRVAVWAVALAAAADVGWTITTHTHQSGWRAVVQPERSLNFFVARNWGEWSMQLGPGAAPLNLCLPEERPLAGFYRREAGRPVSFVRDPGNSAPTAESFVRGEAGWVIVAARRFLGREGHVAARVWLFRGDDGSPYSIAAYRTLLRGETPDPLLYRNLATRDADGLVRELLVKTWGSKPVRLLVSNPGPKPLRYRLSTPLSNLEGDLPQGSRVAVELTLPADSVSQVRLRLTGTLPEGQLEPTVDLAP